MDTNRITTKLARLNRRRQLCMRRHRRNNHDSIVRSLTRIEREYECLIHLQNIQAVVDEIPYFELHTVPIQQEYNFNVQQNLGTSTEGPPIQQHIPMQNEQMVEASVDNLSELYSVPIQQEQMDVVNENNEAALHSVQIHEEQMEVLNVNNEAALHSVQINEDSDDVHITHTINNQPLPISPQISSESEEGEYVPSSIPNSPHSINHQVAVPGQQQELVVTRCHLRQLEYNPFADQMQLNYYPATTSHHPIQTLENNNESDFMEVGNTTINSLHRNLETEDHEDSSQIPIPINDNQHMEEITIVDSHQQENMEATDTVLNTVSAQHPQDIPQNPIYFAQSRSILGERNSVCPSCGAFMWLEEKLVRSSNTNPKFGLCCLNGKLTLPLLPPSPEYLNELFTDRTFMKSIRSYNTMFSFTSMGAKVDQSVLQGGGPYCFRISGENYHRIGSLLPSVGEQNKFVQLYVCDTENEIQNRMNFIRNDRSNSTISAAVIEGLKLMLDNINPYVQIFRTARDAFSNDQGTELNIRILRNRGNIQYIQPSASEIAALIVGDNTDTTQTRDIVVCKREGPLKRISEIHPSYTPLQFPLLFPYGTDGWRTGIPYNSNSINLRDSVSMREFWSYRFQQRQMEGTTMLQGGRLFNQHVVDCFAAIEQTRLNYFKTHQSVVRADLYQGLQDAVVAGDVDAAAVGRRIVLPSSFTGGPRYLHQHYHDALAICRTLGPPDFFITFTCNPNWPEIVRDLLRLPNQRSEDRPDIVARVFRIKQKQLMKILKEGTLFGNSIADVNVIEFQKRGLPHSHITVTLQEQHKPTTTEDIDNFICAEIPDKDADPLAYETVINSMVHGPCGELNPNSTCMVEGKCSKHYPKKFCNHTTIDEDGFVSYRRRNTPHNTVVKNGKLIDNRWIVPYNRDLLVLFNAHINVEKCASAKLMKYMYKYMCKGTDRATIVIENNVDTSENTVQRYRNVDEIKQYLDCRYVSAIEACWRIYEFEIQQHTPTVERLRYHLPDEQYILFEENDNLQDVLNREGITNTMLTKWFEANQEYPEARNLTYVQFPTMFVWKKPSKKWVRRQRGRCIGRLPYAHPASGEKYYLRMLLHVVRGAQSYEDIRTYNGVVYGTFKDACAARGLLDDDNEWNQALLEASTWSSPSNLRNMFATMLMFCEVTNPLDLWNQHWKIMIEDFLYRHTTNTTDGNLNITDDELKDWGLQQIESILKQNGKKLSDFPPMPLPSGRTFRQYTNRLIADALDYNVDAELQNFNNLYNGLNNDQLRVFNAVREAYDTNSGGLFFINGSGGTGKTYLWKTIISKFRSERKIVLSVATSGIASLLLPGGRTAHSRFKIPIELNDKSSCTINYDSELAELIRESALIIWDEAPMMHRHGFEALNRTLADLLKRCTNYSEHKPFKGKVCILGGDFKQILPVVTKGRREAVVEACLHKSPLWHQCKIMHLRQNMRLNSTNGTTESNQQLRIFAHWLNLIGEGRIQNIRLQGNQESDWIHIPTRYSLDDNDNSLQQLIHHTYPDFTSRCHDLNYLSERAILAPKNEDVDEINSMMLRMIQGEMRQYYSADTTCPDEGQSEDSYVQPPELMNTMKLSGIPNHILELKKGTPVMLIKNLNQSIGLCNGTRLIITNLGDRVLQTRILTGSHIGEEAIIPRVVFKTTAAQTYIPMKRRQFPIKISFAMTINKSQGQTLNTVGLYLPNPVFTHGQLYVALSRVTNPKGLKILIKKKDGVPSHCTKNIVYSEVLHAVRE